MSEDIIRSAVILTAVCRGHPVRRGTKCPLHPADNMSALLISGQRRDRDDALGGAHGPRPQIARGVALVKRHAVPK
jgi:hypothetical protein